MITGDIFTPAPLTPEAASYISRLAGNKDNIDITPMEPALRNPSPHYTLDLNRGVINDISPAGNILPSRVPPPTPSELLEPRETLTDTDTITPNADKDTITPNADTDTITPYADTDSNTLSGDTADQLAEAEEIDTEQVMWQAANLVECRTEPLGNGYDNAQQSIPTHAIFTAMSIKEATAILAVRTELLNCINKGVWECLPASYVALKPIPSKLFLTPKHTTEGDFKSLKGRIVGGGHSQEVTIFTDAEVSSPTVALTSVMIGASMAAHQNLQVITLDHTAAYLNAEIKGPPVEMMLSQEVSEMLCKLDPSNRVFVRPNGKIYVKLRKALYGCKQSAVLWYNELKSTLVSMGFVENVYDVCSFSTQRDKSIDRFLVYVDDLFVSSDDDVMTSPLN
jgi:Reverse transcriptase (RNA-dependent DNA polymerase)